MALRSIRGRIQGRDVNIDMAGNRHLLIVGDNGVGKDAIMRIVALALTGGADDLLNRGTGSPSGEPVRAPADLGYLIAARAGDIPDGLVCEVDFDAVPDGPTETARFAVTRNTKGERSRSWTLPPSIAAAEGRSTAACWWVMPTREVYSKITAGPDAARRWFLPYMAQGNQDEAIRAALEKHKLLPRLQDNNIVPHTVEALIELLDRTEAAATEAEGKLTSQTTLLEARRQAVTTARVTADDCVQANAATAAARQAAREERERRAAIHGGQSWRREAMSADIEKKRAFLVRHQGQIDAYRAQEPVKPADTFPDYVPPSDSVALASSWVDLRKAVRTAHGAYLQAHASRALHVCPICGTSATDLSAAPGAQQPMTQAQRSQRLNTFDEAAQQLIRQGAEHRAAWEAQRTTWMQARAAWETWSTTLATEERKHTGWLGTFQQLQNEYEALTSQPDAAPGTDTVEVSLEALEEAERVTEANMLLCQTRYQQWADLDAAEASIQPLRENSTALRGMADGLRTATEEILTATAGAFAEEVRALLPTGVDLRILLRDGEDGRRVFRPGILDETGTLAVALSGGQRLMVMLALSEVILRRIPHATGAAVLAAPDEVSWHPNTLLGVMKALAPLQHTVILLAAVPPATTPPGWLVVDAATVAVKGAAAASEILRGASGKASTRSGGTRKSKPGTPIAAGTPRDASQDTVQLNPTPTPTPEQAPQQATQQAPEPAPEPGPTQAQTSAQTSDADGHSDADVQRLTALRWTPTKIRRLSRAAVARILAENLNGLSYIVVAGDIAPING